MQVSVAKPGSPEEVLAHFGTKGMRWGVRKAVDKTIGTKTAGRKPSSYKSPEARAATRAHRKKVAKRVAIGVGVAATVAGAVYVTHKLNQSGKVPLPGQNRHPAELRALMEKHGSVRMSKREAGTALKIANNELRYQKGVVKVLQNAPKYSAGRGSAKAVSEAFLKGHEQGRISTRGDVYSKIGPKLDRRR